ncbi:hypothetical protein BD560DRAFT_177516 [Blakeslea trispora]|nr:hypothetical protein BD560DRAFT_177516 [Blakeslea trispora]
MMGSVQFPAIDLPTQPQFRLWGLTLGMTSDLVQFTQKKRLEFVQLTRKEPVYSRKDIGYLTRWITQLTLLLKNKAYAQPMTMTMLDRFEWDRVYFMSIRKAAIVASLLRLGIIGVLLKFVQKKMIKKWIK